MNVPSAKLTQVGTVATESPLRDLAAIIRSRTPLIAIESNEEPQVVSLVRQISGQLQLRAYHWTVTEGLQAFDPGDQPQTAVLKSQEVLNYIKTSASSCLFVLLDSHSTCKRSVDSAFGTLKIGAMNLVRVPGLSVLFQPALCALSRYAPASGSL